jgi:hypothetical protein
MIFSGKIKYLFIILFALLFGCSPDVGLDLISFDNVLYWTAPSERIDGTSLDATSLRYRVYFGTSSELYSKSVDVGNSLQFSISNLNLSQGQYFFVITAIDNVGNESGPSREICLNLFLGGG